MTRGSKPDRSRSATAVLPRPSTSAPAVQVSRDLLDNRLLLGFVKSSWYPAIFAYPTLLVFGYIVYALLWGPAAASANLGTSLTWVLWWPLLPLVMFALGRFWCGICPVGTTIDLVQRIAGTGHPAPVFLKKYGIWIVNAAFLIITWVDSAFGIVSSPRGSGYFLFLLLTAGVVTAVLFARRTWCRYICPLGGVAGNYSRTSGLQVIATPEVCATCKDQVCYKGTDRVPGCPVFEAPRAMNSMANCNFCANCVAACPNDSLRLLVRKPTSELWFITRPLFAEAFLAVVLVGIVLVQNFTMLAFWEPLMASLGGMLYGGRVAAFTVVFAAAIALPCGLMLVASKATGAQTGEDVMRTFARFGYAVIPLNLAAHMAHNLFHLLAEGKGIFFNVAALFGTRVGGPAELLPASMIQALQFGLLGLGIAGSLLAAYKIAEHRHDAGSVWRVAGPQLAVLVVFWVVNLYFFTMPMVHRI